MFDAQRLHGIIPPLVTPLTDDERLDVTSFRRLIDTVIGAGVHGIFVLGSTGEMASLTGTERCRVMETAVEAAAGRVPVLVGITETSTARVIEQGQQAQRAGADVAVVGPPYYFSSSQGEIRTHFRSVRAAVDLPLLAYDNTLPIKLAVSTLLELAEEGTIIGVKDSSGDWDSFRQLLAAGRPLPGFRILTGAELMVDAALFLGAHGTIPGLANVVPGEYVRLYEACRLGNWAEATRIQETLLPFFRRLIDQGGPGDSFTSAALAGFKTGLKLLGVLASSRAGLPLRSFTPAEEERVRGVLQEFGYLAAPIPAVAMG